MMLVFVVLQSGPEGEALCHGVFYSELDAKKKASKFKGATVVMVVVE